MTGPAVLLTLSILGCVGLHFSPRHSIREAVCATIALAALLALPVGYAMGSF